MLFHINCVYTYYAWKIAYFIKLNACVSYKTQLADFVCLAHIVLYFLYVYDAYFKPLLDLWFLLLLGLPGSRGDKDDVFVLMHQQS